MPSQLNPNQHVLNTFCNLSETYSAIKFFQKHETKTELCYAVSVTCVNNEVNHNPLIYQTQFMSNRKLLHMFMRYIKTNVNYFQEPIWQYIRLDLHSTDNLGGFLF